MRVLKIYCTNETPMSPADLADDADKPQNQDYKIATITRTTTCLSLRDNAACCIPLRNQRYLRENIHMRGLYQLTKIPQETLTTNCLYLRNNAACGIHLRNLRYLRENIHARVLKLSPKKPQCLPLISLIYADKALITTTTTNCLSLRNNAALLYSSA